MRVVTPEAGTVHFSTDGWLTTQDLPLADTQLGTFMVDLPTENLPVGTRVDFTFYWETENRWETQNYLVQIIGL